jgi:hypothetical protein
MVEAIDEVTTNCLASSTPIPLDAPVTRAYLRAVMPANYPSTTAANPARPANDCPYWPCGAVSERMSIRHPVSRAASRAFWPSRPIANDN